jgi:hypothetical protein
MKPEKDHSKSKTKLWNPITQTYQETESDMVELEDKTETIKSEEQDLV